MVQSCGHYVFKPFQALGDAAANVLLTKPFGSGPENCDFFYVVLHLKTISKHETSTYTIHVSSKSASIRTAVRRPRMFGTSTGYDTPSTLSILLYTSEWSAICGTHFGETKLKPKRTTDIVIYKI